MIGTTLGNYKILEKLGEGGQGAVYKAIDSKLGRTVVIKVLPQELTEKEANLKRFEREARLASALDHPNICTIFDLNQVDNINFIVMQYIEGRNVRELVNGRPLQLESALLIAIQVADALASAHGSGIIHRDIKAGNVMVNDKGQVKVLDFGLAKLVDADAARISGIHNTELTELGIPYGTATYAAPEQARGDRVDGRADIFSAGVLLYEMLTGNWPFRGRTAIDVRHAVLHDEPVPLNEARPGPLPARLQSVLDKALTKDPRDRYQRVGDFRDDLRTILREVTGGTPTAGFEDTFAPAVPKHMKPSSPVARAFRWLKNVSGGEAGSGSRRASSSSQSEPHETPLTSIGDKDRKSVAIMPFKNLDSDEQSAFYEFSLADAVITELARVRSLIVRPSSVIVKYQGRQIDPDQAGRELGVDAVLTASFLRAGERLRVTAQLLDVRTSEILWSERIDAEAADVIGVQDQIVQHIVDGLRLELSPAEKQELAKAAPVDGAASEEYLRGRNSLGQFIYHTIARDDIEAALAHLQRAIDLAPEFALAYSGLGSCYVNRTLKGLGEPGDHEKAAKAFEKALQLDPKLLETRMHMVFIYLGRGEKMKARSEVELLREEYPNDVGVHFVRGVLARLDGDYEKALRSYDRMVRLNPAELVVACYNRARILMYQKRFEDALLELQRGSELEPEHPLIKTFRARVLYYRGEVDVATRILQQVLSRHPEIDGIRPILAICLSAQGRHRDASEQLTEKVKEVAKADHDIAYWLASAFVLQGKQVEALTWLATAIKRGNENYPWFESDPNWSAMHNDQRFLDLMADIKGRQEKREAQTA